MKMELIPFNCSFAKGIQHIFALSWKMENHKDDFLPFFFFLPRLVIWFLSFRQASLLSMISRDKLKVVLIWSFSLSSLLISWTNVLLPRTCVFKSWKHFETHPGLKNSSLALAMDFHGHTHAHRHRLNLSSFGFLYFPGFTASCLITRTMNMIVNPRPGDVRLQRTD